MEFSLRRVDVLEAGGGIWIRSRGQDERRSRLELTLKRRLFRRAARQGRAVRAGRVDGLEIILSEQVEGAEDLVVLQIERPRSLKVPLEGGDVGGLYDELFRCSHWTELFVTLGCRGPRRSPRSAAVMSVGVCVEMRRMVLLSIAKELRHGDDTVTLMMGTEEGVVVGEEKGGVVRRGGGGVS